MYGILLEICHIPDALAKIQKTVNRFKYGNLQTVFNVDSSLANYSGRNYRKYDLRNDNKLPNSLVKDNGTFYIQTQTASNKYFHLNQNLRIGYH